MIRFLVSCCLVLLCGTAALADAPPPIKLLLTPAKPPTPALRYQLLPDARVTISGDAAPVYREVIEWLNKKGFGANANLFYEWSELPLNQLPREEVRKTVAAYDDVYVLLDKAARCEHCDWGLRERLREKGIAVRLPEIQPMRNCAVILRLRARLEMAEGHPDKALLTLRNGFALARHVGESDTLISFLVGVAIAAIMEGQLDELLKQPNAPNLYYALTDLPTPLVDIRRALQGDRLMAYGTFPGFADLATNLDAGNLSPEQLEAIGKIVGSLDDSRFNYFQRVELALLIRNKHEVAKKALIAAGRPRDKVEAMPHVQVALLHAFLEYDTAMDKMIVWHNLPYWELKERLNEMKKYEDKRLLDPNTSALPLVKLLLPAVQKVMFARVRADRKIALLRTIEALRFYAANHDGKLPRSLAAVQEVPIPLDPVTGKSFEYQLKDETATRRAELPTGETANAGNSVIYMLRIRK